MKYGKKKRGFRSEEQRKAVMSLLARGKGHPENPQVPVGRFGRRTSSAPTVFNTMLSQWLHNQKERRRRVKRGLSTFLGKRLGRETVGEEPGVLRVNRRRYENRLARNAALTKDYY